MRDNMREKPKPNKHRVSLWNKLVEEVFRHPRSKYSLFVYEMLKRRILSYRGKEYRADLTSDKIYGIKNA
jgi:hypothetical protein